ncbi:hypothetical protein [Brevundimonas sp.]|uniref:hypothetical protein n=1 Tax=Brevundimonas sp. TaxID=1871086 RepID=UPI00286C4D3D|nr:hypothetical protein [Brevundimonas sp.]
MREIINAAARTALGTPVPSNIKITVDASQRLVTMVGPPASGKTRIARAVPVAQRRGWTCLTGTNQREVDRRFNDEWRGDQPGARLRLREDS